MYNRIRGGKLRHVGSYVLNPLVDVDFGCEGGKRDEHLSEDKA